MKRLGFLIVFVVLAIISQAQSYAIDQSFSPYFDVGNTSSNGETVSGIWENPMNGKLFIVGEFLIREPGVYNHGNLTLISRNGIYQNYFASPIMGGGTIIRNNFTQINNLLFAVNYSQVDSTGAFLNNNYNVNYLSTLRCRYGEFPYFFSDGSSLMANGRGGQPTSCQIYSYNDTFPHQYIVKLNPHGLYDSSFKVYPNHQPRGFVKYDTSRILVYGLVRSFTQYNGKTIDGLCRIFHDGTLDTTFSSPLLNTTQNSFFEIKQIDADGSIFLNGRFLLKNDTANKYRHIVKLKPNGTIDSTFNFYTNLTLNALPTFGSVRAIEATPDGGYLVGGSFDSYNGHVKRNILKLDASGNVEPQYFLGAGPDSSGQGGSGLGGLLGIKASAFGGYYVYGNFFKWDNQRVQPIVRIHDLVTGVESQKLKAESLALYPNPSNGTVNVSNAENIQSVRIYNLQGQLIKSFKPSGNQFELPEKTGMYMIRIEDIEGNVVSKKVIKSITN